MLHPVNFRRVVISPYIGEVLVLGCASFVCVCVCVFPSPVSLVVLCSNRFIFILQVLFVVTEEVEDQTYV